MSPPSPRIPTQVLEYQRRLIGMQKTVFDNTFSAITAFQDQQQALLERTLAQMPGLPGEAQELLETWQKAVRDGRSQFKKAIDDSFDAFETLFDRLAHGDEEPEPPAPRPAPARAAKKPAAKKPAAARKRTQGSAKKAAKKAPRKKAAGKKTTRKPQKGAE